MYLFVLLLLISLATALGLAVVLAFTRAVLYANVLTDLDGVHELQRRLRLRKRAGPANRPEAARGTIPSCAATIP